MVTIISLARDVISYSDAELERRIDTWSISVLLEISYTMIRIEQQGADQARSN